MRAGVEARVKAAMSHGSRVQTELDGIKAVHASELSMLRSQIIELQEYSGQQQQQLDSTLCQLSDFQEAAGRCGNSIALSLMLCHVLAAQHMMLPTLLVWTAE